MKCWLILNFIFVSHHFIQGASPALNSNPSLVCQAGCSVDWNKSSMMRRIPIICVSEPKGRALEESLWCSPVLPSLSVLHRCPGICLVMDPGGSTTCLKPPGAGAFQYSVITARLFFSLRILLWFSYEIWNWFTYIYLSTSDPMYKALTQSFNLSAFKIMYLSVPSCLPLLLASHRPCYLFAIPNPTAVFCCQLPVPLLHPPLLPAPSSEQSLSLGQSAT